MKKLFAMAAALLLFVGAASAQTYFNIGYGQGTTTTKFGDLDPDPYNTNIGYAGISHNFRFGDFVGFELGANFVYDYDKTKDEYEGQKAGVKTEYMGVQVPALFNYKLALSRDLAFKFFLGPTFQYGLKYTSTPYVGKEESYSIDYYGDNGFSRLGISASAAFSVEVAEAFRIKIGYDYGLKDLSPSDDIKTTQNVVNFSLAYMF